MKCYRWISMGGTSFSDRQDSLLMSLQLDAVACKLQWTCTKVTMRPSPDLTPCSVYWVSVKYPSCIPLDGSIRETKINISTFRQNAQWACYKPISWRIIAKKWSSEISDRDFEPRFLKLPSAPSRWPNRHHEHASTHQSQEAEEEEVQNGRFVHRISP